MKQGSGPIAIHAVAAGLPLLPLPPPPAPPRCTIEIVSALDLTDRDLQRISHELAASRHRFVCLQLATMAREAHAAAAAAAAAGDQQAVARAAAQRFALLEAGGTLVAGALFYPRAGSSSGGLEQDAARCKGDAPASAAAAHAGSSCALSIGGQGTHVYIDLMVTSRPGEGWGTQLLATIEKAARRAGVGAVRLLSVGPAQGFYARHGYCGPDASKEMCKLL